jgi:hypothetical protein
MFARTLTALLLCAAPALAAPPTAPMPREARYEMTTHGKYMWWDDEEEVLRLWHELNFERLRRSAYGPLSLQNPREDVYPLAPMPRAVPTVMSSHHFHLWWQDDEPPVYPQRTWQDVRPDLHAPRGYDTGRGWLPSVHEEMYRLAVQNAPPAMPAPEPLVCPPCPLPKIEVNPLLGTWYREFPGEVVALTVTHDEMKLRVTWAGENAGWATVTAQYTLTKDGLAYGAFTGGNGSEGFTDKMAVMMQMLMDAPFSFRFRFTSEGLMIHNLQTCRVLGDGEETRYSGLYTRAKDDKVPAPVAKREPRPIGPPVPPPSAVPSSFVPPPGAPVQMPPAPPTQWKEPVRPASLDTPPAVLPPVLDGPPPVPPARPKASLPADGFKLMADDAFGSLLQQSGVLPKPEPDPLFVAPPAKKFAHVGTWHRETGPMTCVVKIDAEYVTVTATVSAEENGKKVKRSVVITGDYHLARDGTTLVGLVTGLDVPNAGATGKDARTMDGLYEVAKLQKGFVGQPFALTVRAYGDVLVIGDVRMGEHGFGEMAAMLAGRYTSGEPKGVEPKVLPRATSATVPCIPMADADEHARMKELLYQSDTSGPPGFLWKQQHSSDPNVRTQELRSQSDDLRQMQTEWWRFWFNDQPSKLTPERVHGGIY